MHIEKGVNPWRKRSKTPIEVKPLENINKNPQTFPEISFM